MSTKIKVEPEEVQPSTSGGGKQPEEQAEEQVKGEEGEESFDSDAINEEFLDKYCEEVKYIQPMTISKELFIQTKWSPKIMLGYPKLTRRDLTR